MEERGGAGREQGGRRVLGPIDSRCVECCTLETTSSG